MKILFKKVLESGSVADLPVEEIKPHSEPGAERINIYPVEQQSIYGFGGAFTESAAYTYASLKPEQKKEALERLFGESGLKYNFCRICIGSSDFSVDQYDYLDPDDRTLESFSIDRDRKYVIPMIKDAIAYSKQEIIFFASPWCPPVFMKDNASRVGGGHMLPEYYGLYAEYFCKFIEAYEKEGIHITAVTPQNEPRAKSPWDSCIFDADEEIGLIKALSAAFEAHGLNTKILCWDHNKGRMLTRVTKVYKEVGDKVWGGAFHWYSGGYYDEIQLIRNTYPDKLLVETEFCNGLGRKIFDTYSHDVLQNLRHGNSAVCEWNLMLGRNGEPFHDRMFGCSAPVMGDSDGIFLRNHYWEMYMLSQFVERGAKVLATATYRDDIIPVAFRNPDGKIIITVHNNTDANVSYYLSVFDNIFPTTIPIPPHSLVTYCVEE